MNKNPIKFRFIIFVLFFLALCVLAFCVIRFRGGKTVRPNRDIVITENVSFFRQDDNAWAADKLGESEFTMEGSGCLVTCIASALSMSDEEITPGEFNSFCSENNVFDGEGNLLWDALRKSGGYNVQIYSEVSEEMLMECLEQDIFPIVRVRVNGLGNFHYVLIVKAEDEMFYCMDPLQDGLIPLSKYGNRVYAVRSVSP